MQVGGGGGVRIKSVWPNTNSSTLGQVQTVKKKQAFIYFIKCKYTSRVMINNNITQEQIITHSENI